MVHLNKKPSAEILVKLVGRTSSTNNSVTVDNLRYALNTSPDSFNYIIMIMDYLSYLCSTFILQPIVVAQVWRKITFFAYIHVQNVLGDMVKYFLNVSRAQVVVITCPREVITCTCEVFIFFTMSP